MRRAVTVAVTVAALAAPIANAASIAKKKPVRAKAKKRVVTVKKTVVGPQGSAGRWGNVEVTLVVRKTTTIVGKKKTVARKIVAIGVPVYPNHTDRSVFINQQAVPLLRQETLQANFDISKINVISGATDTSYGFGQSLQAALLKAKKV